MEKIFLILVFGISLFLKVSQAAGAEVKFNTLADNSSAKSRMLASNDDEEDMDVDVDVDVQEVIPPRRSKPTIQNNINVNSSGNESSHGSVSATARESRHSSIVSLIPMAGGSGYQGNWYHHIGNTYSLGLAMEFTVSQVVALELEGGYGKYNISYLNYQHDFNQYSYGANSKFYLTRGIFQPFIGIGVMGVTYENMNHGPANHNRYNQTIGAGQALAGADICLSQSVAIGVRGSYVLPLFNRPTVSDNGHFAAPGFEDASAIDSAYYRLMAALKLAL